jgi:hypothetical protein
MGKWLRDTLLNGSRNNAEQLEAVTYALGRFVEDGRQRIQDALDQLKTKPPSDSVIAGWRKWFGCLPWLQRQLALLEGDLKRLGISSIQSPEDRHRIARDQLIRDAVDDIKSIERLLAPFARGRQ